MIRDLVLDREPTKPTIREVHLHITAQCPLRADREHVADDGPERGHLLRHHFIDPDARYVRIALRYLFCSIKAVGAHDCEAGDGFTSQWQILCSSFRDFSTTTEMAPMSIILSFVDSNHLPQAAIISGVGFSNP